MSEIGIETWGALVAIAISVLTFITTQRVVRRAANLETVKELDQRIARLEGEIASCEKARLELVRENQDLLKRLFLNGPPAKPTP